MNSSLERCKGSRQFAAQDVVPRLTSEEALLEAIGRIDSKRHRELQVGMGDDCAVYRIGRDQKRLLVSTDVLHEGVHFRTEWTTPYLIGFKSLAVNVSDVSAMGGHPLGYVVGLSLPADLPTRFVDRLYQGLDSAGQLFDVDLAGGDISRSSTGTVMTITIFGITCGQRPILRSGARPGDSIFVTGHLGLAAIGLQLLRQGARPARTVERTVRNLRSANGPDVEKSHSSAAWRLRCLTAHLAPMPAAGLAVELGASNLVSAMIDLSDGLSTDLTRLCKASKAGALVDVESLPGCPVRILDPDAQEGVLLDGGEDYGLLFTVSARRWKRLHPLLSKHRSFPVTRIGVITDEPGRILMRKGDSILPLLAGGYDHFSEDE